MCFSRHNAVAQDNPQTSLSTKFFGHTFRVLQKTADRGTGAVSLESHTAVEYAPPVYRGEDKDTFTAHPKHLIG